MIRFASGVVVVLIALASCGWFFLYPTAGPGTPAPQTAVAEPPGRPAEPEKGQSTPRTEFAADRDMEYFDAKRAMGYLEELCKIGPRISGTPGMTKQQEMLRRHFESFGAKVEFQRFTARQKSRREPVDMANLIASWRPERTRRVILCSHYDTRPIADQEPRNRWHQPFLSANDGGSGVALLMELAHIVKDLKINVGVDFVLFDGEEYIFNPAPDGDRYFFGSEHFAQTYQKDRPRYRYIAAVLLDMIGGKNARFPVEQNSFFRAGALVEELWTVARQQRCDAFEYRQGPEVRDDHLALNKAGIPAVDIIDFEYAHWHRLSDVPSNCSGESLSQVARVLVAWLKQVK